MLYDWCLNNMNEDELRNYAHHRNEFCERLQEISTTKSEIIFDLEMVNKEQRTLHHLITAMNSQIERDMRFESEMRKKYEEFEPRPCCECEDKHKEV